MIPWFLALAALVAADSDETASPTGGIHQSPDYSPITGTVPTESIWTVADGTTYVTGAPYMESYFSDGLTDVTKPGEYILHLQMSYGDSIPITELDPKTLSGKEYSSWVKSANNLIQKAIEPRKTSSGNGAVDPRSGHMVYGALAGVIGVFLL
ncbi:hypothetical protein DICA0_E39524 [Diutina catenulata]